MKVLLLILGLSFTCLAYGNNTSDKNLIRKVILKNIDKVRACYEQRLKEGLKAEGKLVVTWDVDDTGTAKNFREKTNQLNDGKLFECVVKEIKSWRFPSAPKGEPATIDYPFVFASKP